MCEQLGDADYGCLRPVIVSGQVFGAFDASPASLIPLPEELRGGATVSGLVNADVAGGVLVLAVSEDRARSSAISDGDGAFVLFNVPEGETRIEGYRAGLALAPQTVEVPAAGKDDIRLQANEAALSRVQGSLSIVNAPGGLATSVVLVVASTFDPDSARGATPFGLRAVDVDGAFTIDDVPPGRYAVLAAFESDQLVRDPDQGIAGTEVVHEDAEVPGVSGGDTVSYALDAGDWQPGMLYQFRVFSYRERQGGRTLISASEDLKGVFELAR